MASSPADQAPVRTGQRQRPLSPHLGVYKWGPHMLVSIIHRATGVGMALVGLPLFVWWLAAAAGGAGGYAAFTGLFTTDTGALNPVGWLVGVGLSFAFFQHMASGVRHLFMDTGALFELKANKTAALLTMAASAVLTIAFWAVVLGWAK